MGGGYVAREAHNIEATQRAQSLRDHIRRGNTLGIMLTENVLAELQARYGFDEERPADDAPLRHDANIFYSTE